MILRVPAGRGELVIFVQQQPLVRVLASAPATHENKPALELVAVNVSMQLAGGDGFDRILGLVRHPGARIPHDHVAAAVLAGRDDALEVDVLDRMIFDVDSQPLRGRVQGRPVGHRPAG